MDNVVLQLVQEARSECHTKHSYKEWASPGSKRPNKRHNRSNRCRKYRETDCVLILQDGPITEKSRFVREDSLSNGEHLLGTRCLGG